MTEDVEFRGFSIQKYLVDLLLRDQTGASSMRQFRLALAKAIEDGRYTIIDNGPRRKSVGE